MSVLQKYYTTTTKFILPILFNDNITYKDVLTKVFNDSYIADMKRPEYDDKILVVFHYDEFKKKAVDLYLKEIITTMVDSYIDNNYYVCVYDIPEEYKEDYYKILDSKYNETSSNYYDKVMKFWQNDDKLNQILKAYTWKFKKHMYRIPPIRYKAFDLELEIFNLGVPL